MIENKNILSVNRQKLLLMFLFLYFSSLTSDFQSAIRVVFFVTTAIAIYTHLHYKVPVKVYYFVIIFVLIYFLGQYILHLEILSFVVILRYSCYILIGSYFALIFSNDFWEYYDNVLYFLVIISLPLFFWEIVAFNSIYAIINSIYLNLGLDNLSYASFRSAKYANAIFFTINAVDFSDQFRNNGFVFEPGYFSVLINFALYNLLINKKNKFRIFRLLIYIVGLATTFSTTGLLMFAIIIVNYTINSKRIKMFFVMPIVIWGIFSIPFLSDKIEKAFYERSGVENGLQMALDNKGALVSLGRFDGFTYHFLTVKDKAPVLGFLGIEDKFAIPNISSPNGIGVLIYYFGFFGFVLVMILLYSSCYSDFKRKNIPYSFFFILILVSLFSFPYINAFLFWFLVMYGITQEKKYNYEV